MIALDTNLLVRIVTADDPDQARRAVQLIESNRCWLAKTVLLELEWVLRGPYKLSRELILEVFRDLLGDAQIEFENRAQVVQAVRWFAEGLDFSDSLHLASCQAGARFATFDRPLSRVGSGLEGTPPIDLLR